jgi:hypothetical protein
LSQFSIRIRAIIQSLHLHDSGEKWSKQGGQKRSNKQK